MWQGWIQVSDRTADGRFGIFLLVSVSRHPDKCQTSGYGHCSLTVALKFRGPPLGGSGPRLFPKFPQYLTQYNQVLLAVRDVFQ